MRRVSGWYQRVLWQIAEQVAERTRPRRKRPRWLEVIGEIFKGIP